MSRVGCSGSSGLVSLSNPTRQIRALSGLSDRELLSRVKDLVARERAVTLEVLVQLNEVERRRLHLGLGYPSLFEYCIRHLGYSSSAASRRIQAARCVRDYPEVYSLLENNEVNLITVSLVASILTESNAKDLIAKIRGKSQREVEAIVATYRPPVSMRDRAKPVCVAVTEPIARTRVNSGQSCPIPPSSGSEISPNTAAADTTAASFAGGPPQAGTRAGGSAAGPPQTSTTTQPLPQASTQPSERHRTSSPAPRFERRFHVQFLASERFMKKFERAKALLSNKNGKPSYEAVLEAALDEFLKDHDPEHRKQRREERKVRAEARTKSEEHVAKRTVRSQSARKICGAGCGQVDGREVSSAQAGSRRADDPLFRRWIGGLPATRVPATDEGPSRRIPVSVRDAVFARDKGRCTYTGGDGQECGSTHNLEIDHVVPFARGGTAAIKNLRLLCGKHNRLSAERVFGPRAPGRAQSTRRGRSW